MGFQLLGFNCRIQCVGLRIGGERVGVGAFPSLRTPDPKEGPFNGALLVLNRGYLRCSRRFGFRVWGFRALGGASSLGGPGHDT